MIQEDKQLLLVDLCARLPYGVIIQEYNEEYGYADNALNTIGISYFSIHEACIEGTWINHIENVKPYLRSMSSMTEEEKSEFINCAGYEVEESVNGRHYEYYLKDFVGTKEEPIVNVDAIDWLNAHHFDYRGLIEQELALEAPKGMYGKEE